MLKKNFIFFTALTISAVMTFTKSPDRSPASSISPMQAMASHAGH